MTGAVSIAAALDARIAAIACEVSIKLPNTLFGNTLIYLPAIAASEAEKSAARSFRELSAFSARRRKKRGVNAEIISEKCVTAHVPEMLVEMRASAT